ncbi:MAG: hypothetical protein JO296_13215 [Pseudonocardiales bacterium]|jgi:hypothetical protein|nr:hypothetical protein [Pseudonocardiales bacterium]MBV9651083.1 hypothetical protein [Pseudonocardiales bacterium]
MAQLYIPDPVERADLGVFVARAVRLDSEALVRLRTADSRLHAWVATPFDALVTRSVCGGVDPSDLTIKASDLLAAMAVVDEPVVDPGQVQDALWRCALPPERGWRAVDQVPAEVLADLADQGAAVVRASAGRHGGRPADLLDQKVITVSGAGLDIGVPLRCLFALSGMGFVGKTAAETVRVWATDSWLRLDARYGAVLRRRRTVLPLLV